MLFVSERKQIVFMADTGLAPVLPLHNKLLRNEDKDEKEDDKNKDDEPVFMEIFYQADNFLPGIVLLPL